MPIATTTIFFEDYFSAISPLDNYDPRHYNWDPGGLLTDGFVEIRRGEGPSGEDCVRVNAPTYNCPNCDDNDPADCGTPDAPCFFGMNLQRRVNGSSSAWRHLRVWIRPFGAWDNDTGDDPFVGGILYDEPSGVISSAPDFPYHSIGYVWNGVEWMLLLSGLDAEYETPARFGEWTCVEIASRLSNGGWTFEEKAWVNDVLVYDNIGSLTPSGPDSFAPISGFSLGVYHGQLAGEGKGLDFARVAWADGPIGCGTRGGLPPEDPAPDPDALRCRDDSYETECDLAGECGRVIFQTNGLTREPAGWETLGNGFPSEQSAWYRWVAPRTGRFIWRTRGSEIFNEISVHRHTGALPPPLLPDGFSDEDLWDPTAATSSAVEVAVEQGVEYRIRVASASDGWIIVDFGPAKPVIQDDGWSIDEGARESRTRVVAIGPASGFAVQDSQVASDPSGAGTAPTMDPILFGTVTEL